MNLLETIRTWNEEPKAEWEMRFREHIADGATPSEAEEVADMWLLEWSKPIDYPIVEVDD